MILVPFVEERTTVEPSGMRASSTSVGELPKSKPFTLALPRSPMRKSAGYISASSMEATGTTRAPCATSTAIVVLAL
jgi:hypothetical protein